MDQIKTGNLLRELRREKSLTQEELAEEFGVSRRSVSRWETGTNLPDLDILLELSDFYGVDLRELLDGKRKGEDDMDETKETVLRAEEYANAGREKEAKAVLRLFVVGMLSLIANQAMDFMSVPETFWSGFAKGATAGLALLSMVMGLLYAAGRLSRVAAAKQRIRGRLAGK